MEYLQLEFDDVDSVQDSDDVARRYYEVFKTYFGNIKILRIDTIGDLNFTRMINMMLEDKTFSWFDSVHTLKIY